MSSKGRVLVIDDEAGIRTTLRVCLEGAGYDVALAPSGEAGVSAARRAPPDLALVDLRLGGMDGLAVVRALAQEVPATAVVLMTAYATIDNAVDAMRAGAVDYLPKPFTPAQVLFAVGRVLDEARACQELSELKRSGGRNVRAWFESTSPAMQQALALAARAAATEATVLLLGETGTGKGYVARHIHALSARRERPFVSVNCATVAAGLLERELFGHTRGAFTGADQARAGFVEAAGNGTLFLDEVADLPRDAQGKLLTLLEEHEYVRLGDTEPRRTDARILAATHRDLRAAVGLGAFREDVYYRLNVVAITLPPLRERRDDLPALAHGILADLGPQHRRAPLTLAPATLAALQSYPWPGNLRELVNVLERAVILAEGPTLTPDLLPEEVRSACRPYTTAATEAETLDAAERRHIAAVLARHSTLDAAARALGIDPSTLYRKRERFGLR
jgi:NtrC-family two-component system response regulator AlgB